MPNLMEILMISRNDMNKKLDALYAAVAVVDRVIDKHPLKDYMNNEVMYTDMDQYFEHVTYIANWLLEEQ